MPLARSACLANDRFLGDNAMTEENQCRIVGWLIGAIAVGLLALVAFSGCQMVHGFALDVESAARYTADHTVADR